jgi:hypothetical protein
MWHLRFLWQCVGAFQWSKCSPRQLQRPLVRAPPSDKSIKIQASSMLASVTTMLASTEHHNSEFIRSSTAADSASAHQASQPASPPLAPASPLLQELCPASCQLAITGLLQGRTPTLALASPLWRELHPASSRHTQLPTNSPFQGKQYHHCHYLRLVCYEGSFRRYSSGTLRFPDHL